MIDGSCCKCSEPNRRVISKVAEIREVEGDSCMVCDVKTEIKFMVISCLLCMFTSEFSIGLYFKFVSLWIIL